MVDRPQISTPAAQCQRRFLATTQHRREDKNSDITAGFPDVPAPTDDGRLPDIRDAQPIRTITPATTTEQSPAATESARKVQRQKPQKARAEKKAEAQAIQPQSTSEEPKLQKQTPQTEPQQTLSTEITTTSLPEITQESPRLPLNVLAAYRKSLRHNPTHGVRVASLQLRSYSVRNLEFMCDFALRAAYFLGLPASGPVPLPKKIERWTMPRSNFAHKKSQENFERITRRRAIQILDGHKDVVQIWLAYLRKHQFYGVGMKADVWEFEGMDVAASMDAQFQEVEKELDEKLSMFGWNKQVAGDQSLTEQLRNMGPGQQTGASMMHIREQSRSESRL